MLLNPIKREVSYREETSSRLLHPAQEKNPPVVHKSSIVHRRFLSEGGAHWDCLWALILPSVGV